MVLREKAVETCEKARFYNSFQNFRPTPKPWVVGSSPSAPAKKKAKSNFDLAFFLAGAEGLEPTTHGFGVGLKF